jgi:glycosyltransferase involved in cell wall biosynthesis
MKIAVLSDRDSPGGDTRVAAGLVRGYRALGHETLFLVGQRREHASDATPVYRSLRDQFLLSLPGFRRSHTLQAGLMTKAIVNALRRFRPDVVHLHNMHGQLLGSGETLDAIASRYSVVWTLHDMWAITGGCAHSFGCRKYVTGCSDPCPRRGRPPVTEKLDIVEEWRNKRKAFRRNQGRICLACPSRWLRDLAFESVGSLVRVEHVPNGVDRALFHPLDHASARTVLGIPLDRRVVMSAACNLADKEKGGKLLVEALTIIKEPRPILLTVGRVGNADADFDRKDMGYVTDPRLLALCYAAADVFVLPSLAENQSLVLLEAIACGTPCICFDVGGCGELVRSGETGILVKQVDAASLAEALNTFLGLPRDSLARMRAKCLEASAVHDSTAHVRRYLALMADIVKSATL